MRWSQVSEDLTLGPCGVPGRLGPAAVFGDPDVAVILVVEFCLPLRALERLS